jgi:hypothetical protein
VWHAIGITFDGSTGTLIFYVDGAPLQTFTGYGAMVGNGNAGSETIFGLPFNLGGSGGGSQFLGYADNIFIADRALSASEMAVVQFIPEPASLGLLAAGVLMMFRRRRVKCDNHVPNRNLQFNSRCLLHSEERSMSKFKMSMWICAVALFATVLAAPPAACAVEILYNFDNVGDTATTVIDSRTGDGSQNGGFSYANSAPVAGGLAGSLGNYFAPQTSYNYKDIRTGVQVAYSTAITWSAAIRQTEASVDGYVTLFWTGADARGAGETILQLNPNGSIFSSQSGNWNVTTTATGLLTPGVYGTVGMTADSATGNLTIYKNGAIVQTFLGVVGPMVNNSEGGGASATVFGMPTGVGGAYTERLTGYVDNIFIANRALSPTEMTEVQALPEPTALSVATVAAGLVFMRRRRAAEAA